MEFALNPDAAFDDPVAANGVTSEGSTFRISSRPLIDRAEAGNSEEPLALLPRSYGTDTLTLMARDPHSVFAYWDIDWKAAFRAAPPYERKVHLRILDAEDSQSTVVEIEPMAGSCYVSVPNANSAYAGEIGFFHPADVWNPLKRSDLVTTPPETNASDEEVDFATVPFHLSFQHMLDMLRISKQENESLVHKLQQLRERAAAADKTEEIPAEQREIAEAMNAAERNAPPREKESASGAEFWTPGKRARIFGFGTSSPSGGFGGSSRAS